LDRVDIITGGFPCQPFSVAGKQDPNDNRQLWPEMFRIIKEIRPTYVIGENVRNLISIRDGVVFEQVCTDLESEGYEVQTFVLSASAVNAPHQRFRCWIVAHAKSSRYRGRSSEECRDKQGKFQQSKQRWSEVGSKVKGCSEPHGKQDVANSDSRISETFDKKRILGKQNKKKSANRHTDGNIQKRGQGNIVGRMGGTADGLSKGLDRHWGDGWEEGTPRVAEGQKNRANRLKGLGNAVVPQIPAALGRAILEVHNG
jgi:DNA (cytosine-5)-methyltransferase 1